MKYKNFKSAIHNFAHSFQSIDILKSPKYAINILIELNKKGIPPIAVFDFVNQTIEPIEANTKSGKQLLQDYLDWLPSHFLNHSCDIEQIEKLTVEIEANFENLITPSRINDSKELVVKTRANWKVIGKKEKIINIKQTELIKIIFIKDGIPEII